MVFLILLVIVVGMVISTMQFGTGPDGASITTAASRAELYAKNMITWHQGAIMMVSSDNPVWKANRNTLVIGQCTTPNVACAVDLNATNIIWPDVGHTGPIGNIQPEYQPVVNEGNTTLTNSGGWQSFYIQGINGTNTSIDCTIAANTAQCQENYVLTVFRGYGYGGTYTSNNIGNNVGSSNNASLATALSKAIQDRVGVGNLVCSGGNTGNCTFTRAVAYSSQATGATQDLPLQFPIKPFTSLQGTSLPSSPPTLDQVLNGLPAIMTRVGGGLASEAVQTCNPEGIAWSDTGTVSQPAVGASGTYECYGTLNGGLPYTYGYSTAQNVTATGFNPPYNAGSLSAKCDATGHWTVSGIPTCTKPGGCSSTPGSCPNNASATWTVIGSSGSATCSGTMVAAGCANTTNGATFVIPNTTPNFGGAATALCTSGTWSFVGPGSGCTATVGMPPPGGTIGVSGATGSGNITAQ